MCIRDSLLYAARAGSGYTSVVITMRIDLFEETDAHHPDLAHEISQSQSHLLLHAMTDENLEHAIAEPAAQAGQPFDASTIALLLGQARGREGTLPLLEFALTCIWDGLALSLI